MDERDLVGIGESPPVKLAGRDDDFCYEERYFVEKRVRVKNKRRRHLLSHQRRNRRPKSPYR